MQGALLVGVEAAGMGQGEKERGEMQRPNGIPQSTDASPEHVLEVELSPTTPAASSQRNKVMGLILPAAFWVALAEI